MATHFRPLSTRPPEPGTSPEGFSPAASSREQGPRDATPRLALVVDDEPMVRALISRLLARSGWSVLQAPDGAAALAVLGNRRPSLVVTDYEMPSVNGFELATRLRLSDSLVPIMMISGRPADAARIMTLPGGHTAYAVKPFAAEEFVATVDALVTGA